MRFSSPRHRFLDHLGSPEEAKIKQKSNSDDIQMMLRRRKLKMLFFDTPPIKNQRFWAPMEVQMVPKSGRKPSFKVSEHVLDMNIEKSRVGQGGRRPNRARADKAQRRSPLDKTPIWL